MIRGGWLKSIWGGGVNEIRTTENVSPGPECVHCHVHCQALNGLECVCGIFVASHEWATFIEVTQPDICTCWWWPVKVWLCNSQCLLFVNYANNWWVVQSVSVKSTNLQTVNNGCYITLPWQVTIDKYHLFQLVSPKTWQFDLQI